MDLRGQMTARRPRLRISLLNSHFCSLSGGGGIRTLETPFESLAVFKTAPFDRSGTPPGVDRSALDLDSGNSRPYRAPGVGGGAGAAAGSGGLRAPLRHRDFRYLAGGLATSQVGEWLASLALIVFVLAETGSAGWVAAAGTARLLPYVALAPIGGTIADRLPRLKVLIASDLLRAFYRRERSRGWLPRRARRWPRSCSPL